MEGFRVTKRKKRPPGYPGWTCVIACCGCDADWLVPLLEQFRLVYAQDPENITMEIWKHKKNKRECELLFISFPSGDEPLVTFILSGLNLIVQPWDGDPINANKLGKPVEGDMTVHTLFESMIESYKFKEHDRLGEMMKARKGDRTAEQEGFYLFMCLLGSTLIARSKAKQPSCETDMSAYLRFHERHNGRDSKQYAQALVLRVFCFGFTHPTASNDLQNAAVILGKDDSMLNMLLGHALFAEGDFVGALSCYRHTHVLQAEEIAARLCEAGRWHEAYPFTLKAKSVNNPSEENMMRFLQCLCALGDKRLAIQTVGITNRKRLDCFKKSEYRFCWACRKIGLLTEMISCETCGDAYYCCAECLWDDAAAHIAFSCRNCNVCAKQIPKPQQRMRCSGCWVVFYCSKECQHHDWFENGHKDSCCGSFSGFNNKDAQP